jgi:hypothetical protein
MNLERVSKNSKMKLRRLFFKRERDEIKSKEDDTRYETGVYQRYGNFQKKELTEILEIKISLNQM